MPTLYKQYLPAKKELENSMKDVKSLHDQWLVATAENPTNLTKKQVDHITKSFKNKLLTAKWDCEDLEEILSSRASNSINFDEEEAENGRDYIEECRRMISNYLDLLEATEANHRLFSKHGIFYPALNAGATTTVNPTTKSIVTSSSMVSHQYEKVVETDANEIHFDKNQIEASATIFNNALYDHIESSEDRLMKSFSTSQVFNNLTRPVTNVYMNPNEDEVILDMLETEYYNPPDGLNKRNKRFDQTLRKFSDTGIRSNFLRAVLVLLSFSGFMGLLILIA